MSQITSHILDTARGQPAAGVAVYLEEKTAAGWKIVGHDTTNADGRVPVLLPAGQSLVPGVYKMRFETEAYFQRQGVATFYPFVEIVFYLRDTAHYHVPLLISAFGFTTYRGS